MCHETIRTSSNVLVRLDSEMCNGSQRHGFEDCDETRMKRAETTSRDELMGGVTTSRNEAC